MTHVHSPEILACKIIKMSATVPTRRPFIIYLLGPQDLGKTLYSAALIKIATTLAKPMKWRGQTWKLTMENLASIPNDSFRSYLPELTSTQKLNPVTQPTAIDRPGIYCFTLTRDSLRSDRSSQQFIVFDPSGAWAIPQTAADRQQPEMKSIERSWELCNPIAERIFRQPLATRMDALLFINGNVAPKGDPIKSNPAQTAQAVIDYITSSLSSNSAEDSNSSKPFLANFILYYTASEFLFTPMAHQTLNDILMQVNASPRIRAKSYSDYVDIEYKDYVQKIMDVYAKKLRASLGYLVDTEPFFGSPPGQTLDGRRNWSFRTNTFIDFERWHPLFVLEPLIELVCLSWGEPA